MATLTTGIVLMRWQLTSALLMFIASTLNIQLRKFDHGVMAFFASGIGIAASCWFATGLLGVSINFPLIWVHLKDLLIESMNNMPPEWPAMMA